MDQAAAFLDENRAFGELIRAGDPSSPVPTCPEWSLNRLFRHVGRGNLWSAQIVADRRDSPLDPRDVAGGKPPADPDEAVTWLHDGAQRLVDAVARVGADTPVWTFVGPRPAHWWIRRRRHEVAVHRADAALALGRAFTLSPESAADAISEWLDVATARLGDAPPPLGDGESLHLHATDTDGEWTVAAGPDGLSWSHQHGKGSVALRGGATELLLATLRRVPVAETGITVFGDEGVWERWLDRTPF